MPCPSSDASLSSVFKDFFAKRFILFANNWFQGAKIVQFVDFGFVGKIFGRMECVECPMLFVRGL